MHFMSEPATETTRDALLDAAERRFAANGVDGTSVREITGEARANVAAVNYYFGSKDGLVREVFARRLRPLNAARLARLDALERGGAVPSVEAILEAFLAPAIDLRRELGRKGRDFACLMGRALAEPGGGLPRILADQFRGTAARYRGSLERALPDADPDELHWRLFFVVGALAFVVSREDLITSMSAGRCDPADNEGLLRRLVAHGAAGMRAAADAEVAGR